MSVTADASTSTVGGALARCRGELARAGLDSTALEARLLVAHALGVASEAMIAVPEKPLPRGAELRLDELLRRRLGREPMAYILGHREFWSLDFAVTPDVLIPRPDSETVVAAALERVADRNRPLAILDLGTGTGCLLLALLAELPQARGFGIDCSAAAITVARRNAAVLGFAARASFERGEWARGLDRRFEIIVCNPPYVASGDIVGLAPEVQREPLPALDGGADGLAAYRAIAPDLRRVLAVDGVAAFEIGSGQAAQVEAILCRVGLEVAARRSDFSGIERCLVARPAR